MADSAKRGAEEDTRPPQINVSKIAVDGGIAGAIFAIGSMVLFLVGIPVLRWAFPVAVVVGCVVALVLRAARREKPGTDRLLPVMEEQPPDERR